MITLFLKVPILYPSKRRGQGRSFPRRYFDLYQLASDRSGVAKDEFEEKGAVHLAEEGHQPTESASSTAALGTDFGDFEIECASQGRGDDCCSQQVASSTYMQSYCNYLFRPVTRRSVPPPETRRSQSISDLADISRSSAPSNGSCKFSLVEQFYQILFLAHLPVKSNPDNIREKLRDFVKRRSLDRTNPTSPTSPKRNRSKQEK